MIQNSRRIEHRLENISKGQCPSLLTSLEGNLLKPYESASALSLFHVESGLGLKGEHTGHGAALTQPLVALWVSFSKKHFNSFHPGPVETSEWTVANHSIKLCRRRGPD